MTIRTVFYQSLALVALGAPQPYGGTALNPEVFARPFPATEQQFAAFQPAGTISNAPNTTTSGWQPLNAEVFAKPFPVAEQQALALAPEQVPTAITPHGFEGWQYDYHFTKPFPVAEQQFLALDPERVPRALDAQGFYPQPPDLFGRRFPVAEQQFLTYGRGIIPTAPTAHGWEGAQLECRFAKPFPVVAQQFWLASPERILASITFEFFPHPPDLFGKPFPVSEQLFQGWPPEEVPPFHAPGAGKRKDFPSYIAQPPRDGKPNKPVRPIWDVLQEIEKRASVGGHSQPVPLPPPYVFAPPQPAASAPLPDLNRLAPPNVGQFAQQMRELEDQRVALEILRKLGLIS
ncbi:MAG: hypothetical protein ACLPKB_24750 [Xanthobacteraceae bacterium]